MGGSLGREWGDYTSVTWNSVAINHQDMHAAFLPGSDKVELRTLPVPHPAHGEVLLRGKAAFAAFTTDTWAKVPKDTRE